MDGGYNFTQAGKSYHSSSLEVIPKINQKNGKILALGLQIRGISMNFLMGRPEINHTYGIQRPRNLVFKNGVVEHIITLNWSKYALGSRITYTHVGTYKGVPPGHDLPRTK